ncbi:MAG: c-type cytochrome [Myxococcales bacterium]|nr:c-type cytochrome [Myxococcales bacterium]
MSVAGTAGTKVWVVGALAVAAIGGGTVVLTQCTRGAGVRDGGDATLVAAARDYRTYCGLCHGDEGEGYAADNANALRNQQFLASVSDEFLRVNIERGHPGTSMAAYGERYGGPLDDGQIEALVRFLRAWQTVPPAEMPEPEGGNALAGAGTYRTLCASCHGARGEGTTALSLNNPIFLETASDAQIRYAIAKGREGTPMPGFEERLSPARLDDLVALIRSWGREVDDPGAAHPELVRPELPEQIVLNPDGGAPTFSPLRDGRYVPSAEVARALERGSRIIFLDARAPSDYVRYHLPGAVVAPYYDVEQIVERLPRDGTWIIAYCGCPHAASGRVMDALRDRGFANTAVLDEGVIYWKDEGYPVVTGPLPGTMADAE